MKFTLKEIPDNQLALIGLSKNDLQKFPKQTLDTLLSGNRTSLMRLNNIQLPGMDRPVSLDAKLSLERKADGAATLRLHPINHVAQNVFSLSKEEEILLQKEKKAFIKKEVVVKNGDVVPVMVALDKTTNEYVAVKEKDINIPIAINGEKLTDKQKTDFIKGNNIQIQNDVFRFNPTKERVVQPVKGHINSIELKHGKYNNVRLLIDVALLASGLGGVVLLEHLLDLAANSKLNMELKQNLDNKEVRDAISTAIAQTAKDHRNMVTPDELMDILTDKLKSDTNMSLSDIVNSTSENNSVDLKTNETEQSIKKSQSLPQGEADRANARGIRL